MRKDSSICDLRKVFICHFVNKKGFEDSRAQRSAGLSDFLLAAAQLHFE